MNLKQSLSIYPLSLHYKTSNSNFEPYNHDSNSQPSPVTTTATSIIQLLETVDHDAILLSDFAVNKKLLNVISLISGELNDFTILFVVDNRSVTIELLFESFREFLLVVFLFYSLQGCNGFTSVTLLNTNVNLVLKHFARDLILGFVSGVELVELHVGHGEYRFDFDFQEKVLGFVSLNISDYM